MAAGGTVYVGTSGWHYAHWRGPFYPGNVPPAGFLTYYAARFCTVEINNSFYRMPQERTFAAWRDSTPAGFVFAVKASRYITHMKKLKDPEEAIALLMGRLEALGDKLGPILFQLPPRWGFNRERLEQFLAALPVGRRYAFEFRDPGWLQDAAYELLSGHGAALCVYEFAGRRAPGVVTADFVYVRLHGPRGAYQGQYDDRMLAEWAETVRGWAEGGIDVYCYFDNDERGYAVQAACRLRGMLRLVERCPAECADRDQEMDARARAEYN